MVSAKALNPKHKTKDSPIFTSGASIVLINFTKKGITNL